MFGKRLVSGIVLVILALVLLLQGGGLLGFVLMLLSEIAFRELVNACHQKKDKICFLEISGYIGILLFYIILILSRNGMYMLGALIVLFMCMMAIYVFSFPRYEAKQVMTTFFCAFYAAVPFGFVYLTREMEMGIYTVWLIFISSWICDTCAYCVGMLIGKHKLAPVLSPKKSIEGAVGGVAGSALVGALFGWLMAARVSADTRYIWVFAVIGAVGAVISQIGDLAASAIKRNHDIKDYGKLIPGHGGIMDRFDSVLFTAPVIYYLAVLLTQIIK